MARILFVFALLSTSGAWAQQVRVEKVKGNKAIVEFTGTPPTVGKTYSLSGSSSSSASAGGSGSRERSIGLDFNFSSLTNSVNSNFKRDELSVGIRYGWNDKTYEYGPIFAYSNLNVNGTETNTLNAGGFFEYNFTPNVTGTEFVSGVGAEAGFGSAKTGSSTASIMSIAPMVFIKWFPFGNAVAIRTDLQYGYSKYSGGGAEYTMTGIVLNGGIAAYF